MDQKFNLADSRPGDLTVTIGDIHWIVGILTDDSVIVESRERLYSSLGLPRGELHDLRTEMVLHGSGSYGFLTSALNKWISLRGLAATFSNLDKILRDEYFNTAADKICESLKVLLAKPSQGVDNNDGPHKKISSTRRKESLKHIWFEVPERIKLFTGRERELRQLHKCITGAGTSTDQKDMTVITTVSGMGGIGKTTLAIKYVWEYHTHFSSNIVWINAQSLTSLNDSFIRLAIELQLEIADPNGVTQELKRITEKVYKNFTRSKSLFIFDNTETYSEIKPFLPARNAPLNKILPHVLITSRNKVWNDNFLTIELNVFTPEEALTFLQNYLSLQTAEELILAKKLTNTLQNLPIAIRQAGAFVKMQKENSLKSSLQTCQLLEEYLTQFEVNCKALLEFEYWIKTGESTEKTTFVTWNLTLEKIKKLNSLSSRIMELIPYLSPDNIPVEFFYHLESDQHTEIKKVVLLPFRPRDAHLTEESILEEAVNLLIQYSIIVSNNGSISVHRLVQRVIREQNKLNEVALLLQGLKILEKFPGRQYSQHLQAIWKHTLKHDKLVKKFTKFGIGACKFISFNDSGESSEILEDGRIIEETIKKFKVIYPKKPKYIMEIMFDEITNMSRATNPKSEMILELSKILYENCLVFQFNDEGRFTYYQLELIGNSLFRIGQRTDQDKLYELAVKFYKIFHEYNKRRWKYDYFYILQTCTNIIQCLVRLQKIQEAIEIVTENETLFNSTYGHEHPKTLNALVKLANRLLENGRVKATLVHPPLIKKSLQISRKIHAVRKRLNGEEDFDTLFNLQQVVTCLLLLGEAEQVEEGLTKARTIFEIVDKNSDKLNYLQSLYNVAVELGTFGFLNESLKYLLYVEEKQIQLDCLAEYKDYHLIKTRKALGGISNELGLFREALGNFLLVHHSMVKLRFYGPGNSETQLIEKEIREIRKL